MRLLCPWNPPGKNTGVGSHSFLLGIFPTQGLSLGLLHCRRGPGTQQERGPIDRPSLDVGRRKKGDGRESRGEGENQVSGLAPCMASTASVRCHSQPPRAQGSCVCVSVPSLHRGSRTKFSSPQGLGASSATGVIPRHRGVPKVPGSDRKWAALPNSDLSLFDWSLLSPGMAPSLQAWGDHMRGWCSGGVGCLRHQNSDKLPRFKLFPRPPKGPDQP